MHTQVCIATFPVIHFVFNFGCIFIKGRCLSKGGTYSKNFKVRWGLSEKHPKSHKNNERNQVDRDKCTAWTWFVQMLTYIQTHQIHSSLSLMFLPSFNPSMPERAVNYATHHATTCSTAMQFQPGSSKDPNYPSQSSNKNGGNPVGEPTFRSTQARPSSQRAHSRLGRKVRSVTTLSCHSSAQRSPT